MPLKLDIQLKQQNTRTKLYLRNNKNHILLENCFSESIRCCKKELQSGKVSDLR